MVIKVNATDVTELETMYLGVMSHHLTEENGFDTPEYEDMRESAEEVGQLYDEADVPFLYFGARHYHWSKDSDMAEAVLDAGAVQTSTDVGSANIGEEGVGTTPHFLTLTLAGSEAYDREDATLATAELFDEQMDEDIPRTTLIDTFNREVDEALQIAEYFEETTEDDDWTAKFRVDTCGENVMQGGQPYDPEAGDYETGTGVRISGIENLRDRLIEEGYGDNTEIILSSGFGNPEKAEAFVEAQEQYREESAERFGESYDLFHGIGAGSFDDGIHCTADIYEVDGEPMAKEGREQDPTEIERYIDEHMEQVI
jgi:nicotinate phosphoribosyltransferase